MNIPAFGVILLGCLALALYAWGCFMQNRAENLQTHLGMVRANRDGWRQYAKRLQRREAIHLAAAAVLVADMRWVRRRCCHVSVKAWRRRGERKYRSLSMWTVRGR